MHSADKPQTDVMKKCMASMLDTGLQIYPYTSVQGDEVLVLIKCPDDVLKSFCSAIEFQLLGEPQVIKQMMTEGCKADEILPREINEDSSFSSMSPYESIYLPYDAHRRHDMYHIEHGEETPFSKNVKLKLGNALPPFPFFPTTYIFPISLHII